MTAATMIEVIVVVIAATAMVAVDMYLRYRFGDPHELRRELRRSINAESLENSETVTITEVVRSK